MFFYFFFFFFVFFFFFFFSGGLLTHKSDSLRYSDCKVLALLDNCGSVIGDDGVESGPMGYRVSVTPFAAPVEVNATNARRFAYLTLVESEGLEDLQESSTRVTFFGVTALSMFRSTNSSNLYDGERYSRMCWHRLEILPRSTPMALICGP